MTSTGKVPFQTLDGLPCEGLDRASLVQESEDRFKIMAEESPVALWLHRDGRYVYVNPAAVRLFRAGSPSDLLGGAILDQVPPEDRAGATARIMKALAHPGEIGQVEARLLRLDGTDVEVALASRAVTLDGLPTLLIFAQDLTPVRKAREEELRALKAESLVLMAGGIAHDFNNLFQALQTTLDVVEIQSRTYPDMLHAVRGAKEILGRAVTLSWKMLDFAGRAVTRPVPVSLPDLLAAWARSRGDVDLALAEVPTVKADPAKLEKVLGVFLENAREALDDTGLEGGRVRVELALDPGGGTGGLWVAERPAVPVTVRLTIASDGPVPPPEVLARMFDPFFTTKALGRGLGLPSALGLLQAHGAGLHLAPGPTGGLAFSLHFPPA